MTLLLEQENYWRLRLDEAHRGAEAEMRVAKEAARAAKAEAAAALERERLAQEALAAVQADADARVRAAEARAAAAEAAAAAAVAQAQLLQRGAEAGAAEQVGAAVEAARAAEAAARAAEEKARTSEGRFEDLLAHERSALEAMTAKYEQLAQDTWEQSQRHIEALEEQLRQARQHALDVEADAAARIERAHAESARQVAEVKAQLLSAVERAKAVSAAQASAAARQREDAREEAKARVQQTQRLAAERVEHAVRRAMTATQLLRQGTAYAEPPEGACRLGRPLLILCHQGRSRASADGRALAWMCRHASVPYALCTDEAAIAARAAADAVRGASFALPAIDDPVAPASVCRELACAMYVGELCGLAAHAEPGLQSPAAPCLAAQRAAEVGWLQAELEGASTTSAGLLAFLRGTEGQPARATSWLAALEDWIVGPFCLGARLTYADFLLAQCLEVAEEAANAAGFAIQDLLAQHPKVLGVLEGIRALDCYPTGGDQ